MHQQFVQHYVLLSLQSLSIIVVCWLSSFSKPSIGEFENSTNFYINNLDGSGPSLSICLFVKVLRCFGIGHLSCCCSSVVSVFFWLFSCRKNEHVLTNLFRMSLTLASLPDEGKSKFCWAALWFLCGKYSVSISYTDIPAQMAKDKKCKSLKVSE